ncbi:Hpt domain-containing protein [Stenotrophomonas sp. Iso1]|uniref:hybrid sensor histidine kinase/response regulator n=1 Tax=Stenotrophomonas sp. Iso1 TaxID=2977283 RepID=UPI0022B7D14C|nr:Hpt domain-containing protein [Stenotrophomonas sp. Iso1]
MSTLRDAMSHAALGWVKPELDETLRQVRSEVEYFVEDPGDTSRMRFCAGYLHQVQGTLRMVELYAPAMVAEELEQLANAVRDGAVTDRDEACGTLMRGTVLLPDYLERLQNGHRDIPIVLLPLLNEIRAARGVEGINEGVLLAFNPDASNATPDEVEHARGSLSGRNRELLDTVGSAVKEELMRIKDALDLHVRTGGNPADLQVQVSELGAVADTLGVMGLGVARGIVGQQRDALRDVVSGARIIDDNLLLDIAGALLYVDASLDDQVEHLGANPGGEDDAGTVETRRTVEVLAHEAIANFTAARESFVAFIETNWDHQRLAEVPRLLDEVCGALRMLEIPEPAGYLQAVRQYIQAELIERQRVPSGRQLDTLADAMASLEYYLEALRDRRPGREEILDITRTSLETLRYWPLPSATDRAEPVEIAAPWATAARDGTDDTTTLQESPIAAEAPEPTPVAASAVPPPLPSLADVQASTDTGIPLVFAAAINAKPMLVAPESAPEVASDSQVFDPVAAEDTSTTGDTGFTLAPLTLDGFERDEASEASALEPLAFDPIAAERDTASSASTDVYTFDSSLLELDVQDEPAAEPQSAEPAYNFDLDAANAFFEPVLEETAPVMPDAQVSGASLDWQLDAAPLANAELEPLELPTDSLRNADVPAVALETHVDAETAAFMAELNAASESFGSFTAAADVAEPVAEIGLTQAASITATPFAGAATHQLEGGFIDNGDAIDQDIREVFIEEFDEELVNLGNLLPAWRAAPGNAERLRPVRRVFHTLKGSGRLVGARTLGEFSWKIESMLNRVLEGSRSASPAVVAMVSQAYDVLPELNAALRGNGTIQSDLIAMQDVAERIAAGEEAFHIVGATAAPAATDEPVFEAAPLNVDDGEGMPASVDSVLREILEAEIGVHLETVNHWLAQSQLQPQPASEDLLRAVHTMSGAFAMTDVPVITGITTPAESFVKRSLAAGITPTASGVDALAQMAAAAATTIAALSDPSPRIPAFPGVAERLQALADALPDAKWPPMAMDEDVAFGDAESPFDAEPEAEQGALEKAPRAALEGVEDLSAYFDPTLLDGTLGDLPSFLSEPVRPVAPPYDEAVVATTEQSFVEAPAIVASVDEPSELLQVETLDFSDIGVPDTVEAEAAHTSDTVVADERVVPAPLAEEIVADEISLADADLEEVALVSAASVDAENAANDQLAVELQTGAVAQRPAMDFDAESATESFEVEKTVVGEEAADAAAVENDAVSAEIAATDASQTELPVEAADVADAPVEVVTETETEIEAAGEVIDNADELDIAAIAPAVIDDIEEETASVEIASVEIDETAEASDAIDVEASAEASQPSVEEVEVAEAEEATSEAAVVEDSADIEEQQEETIDELPSEPTRIELAPLTAPLPDDAAPPVTVPLAAQFDAGPLDFSELDRELIDIFVEEGKDLLDHCDGLVSELRSAPEDREALAGLQRDLHTLKGGARMAGINAIGDLGHSIESLLEAVAANRTEMTRSDVQLLERGFDRLHQLLTRTGEHRAVLMPTDLLEAFETRTEGRAEAAAGPAVAAVVKAASVTTVQAPAAVVPQPLAANEPLSAPLAEEQASEEDGSPRGQEQVRVRADLLDSLVNHAGEVAIYRSRLEQQLGAFRGAMAELDRTNARLRDQLRRLDLETEAQIVARYRREHEQADQTFDPLELDRFSTLQQLSRALNESAADLGGLQGVLDDLSRNYDVLLQQQSRVSSELQEGLMRARMVPFDGLVPRLRRVVRQAAHETEKQVHLKLEGTHGELDRNVLDRMVAPLEHMLRNSVAHGLEQPAARVEAGKPEEGEITLRLRREGSEIVLEVGDDGAGLDREAIRRRAEQRGLLAANEELDDVQLDQMIFASGFSTSEQVSQLAGRGVGMDVVRNEVRQLGGSVDIHSVRGQGAMFTLRLPQTLAVTQAVFVRIGETTYAVPVASVSGIGRISRERFEAGQGGYHYNGEDFTLYNLGALVGHAAAKAEGQAEIPLLLVRSGDLRAAVAIDQVLGNREIVVKPVGLQLASVPGIYGATITGEGNVVVILDVAPLVRRHLAQPQQPVETTVVAQQRHVPLVMVVDDSLTMRKVTGRVLERHNFEVVVARDGIEALEQLEERVPDLMLLDIEMPRMDGYELATAMRADARYKGVPIVMITSRSGDKHRQRAFEIGVQRYLGKPYQELDLMRNVYDLLGIARVRD